MTKKKIYVSLTYHRLVEMLRSFRRLVARFSELRDPEAVIIWNPLMDVLSNYVRLCSLRLLHKELGHSLARRATVSPKSRAPRPLKFEASFHACLPHNCAVSITRSPASPSHKSSSDTTAMNVTQSPDSCVRHDTWRLPQNIFDCVVSGDD